MQSTLYGSHWLLRRLPWWVIMFFAPIPWLGYWTSHLRSDGIGYNISLSATVGDFWLFVAVALVADSLANPQLRLTGWVTSKAVHVGALAISSIVGLGFGVNQMLGHTIEALPDTFHNTVYVPLFLYMLISIMPIALHREVVLVRKVIFVSCLLGWLAMLLVDVHFGLLGQYDWLIRHGFQFRP